MPLLRSHSTMVSGLRLSLTVLVLMIALSLFADSAYAHRMVIRPVETGLVKVIYEDNTRAKEAIVILYDQNEAEILEGRTDRQGLFSFDPGSGAVWIVANDGLGHKARLKIGQPVTEEPSKLPIILLTSSALLFIAAFFHYRNSKTSDQAPPT